MDLKIIVLQKRQIIENPIEEYLDLGFKIWPVSSFINHLEFIIIRRSSLFFVAEFGYRPASVKGKANGRILWQLFAMFSPVFDQGNIAGRLPGERPLLQRTVIRFWDEFYAFHKEMIPKII